MELVKVYKEHQYLVFEFDNQSKVKYDLGTNEYIGKRGNPVKSLTSQFSCISIQDTINKFDNEKYRKFLQLIYNRTSGNYSNLGTFLSKIKEYSKVEQYVLCDINVDFNIKYKLSNSPKGLIKLLKGKDIILSNKLILRYLENPDIFTNLFNKEYDMFDNYKAIISNYSYDNIINLIKIYNCNLHALCEYINNITSFEGYDVYYMTRELVDYHKMMKTMTNKYEKYPHNLSTQHMITIRNYNRYNQDYNEELFFKRINTSLEFSYKDYVVIYPKLTEEVKKEGNDLSHCVSSYIDKVINGTTNILFLRKKNEPNKSLITLEVKNGKVIQARGRFNVAPTKDEQEIINIYKEKVLNKLFDKAS